MKTTKNSWGSEEIKKKASRNGGGSWRDHLWFKGEQSEGEIKHQKYHVTVKINGTIPIQVIFDNRGQTQRSTCGTDAFVPSWEVQKRAEQTGDGLCLYLKQTELKMGRGQKNPLLWIFSHCSVWSFHWWIHSGKTLICTFMSFVPPKSNCRD